MQLALAESPACHYPFPNIFCNNPDLMIYNLRTVITISSLVPYRLIVYMRGPQGLNGPFGSWAPILNRGHCVLNFT